MKPTTADLYWPSSPLLLDRQRTAGVRPAQPGPATVLRFTGDCLLQPPLDLVLIACPLYNPRKLFRLEAGAGGVRELQVDRYRCVGQIEEGVGAVPC